MIAHTAGIFRPRQLSVAAALVMLAGTRAASASAAAADEAPSLTSRMKGAFLGPLVADALALVRARPLLRALCWADRAPPRRRRPLLTAASPPSPSPILHAALGHALRVRRHQDQAVLRPDRQVLFAGREDGRRDARRGLGAAELPRRQRQRPAQGRGRADRLRRYATRAAACPSPLAQAVGGVSPRGARPPPAAPPFTSAGWAAAVEKTNAPPPALYLSTHQPARQPTILACCCF